ncbi:polysaccharide pyruvyl transferase family protein [Paenibacillus montanisoli]|uniref:Polysaccharide pyruvyl transferase family protein n=1 Tax=Paenibacillus montanisoli TaxID=2081970 RepID=A0A328TZH7_9BACL|nr:polysaccharide pyruvyl transferase family protein [Paenibacillus montanisoli]RAP74005.1 polysaccharide pyruvyl transferase family protein [Paenibacillus montanisoli]
MKKIGILTFHRSINYGAVLQAYALKSVITKLGAHCNIIDYKNQYIDEINRVKLFDFNSSKSFINGILTYAAKKEKYEKFVEFREKYLVDEERDLDISTLNQRQNYYDAYITGSDQVWNYGLSNFDKTYFLDFVSDSKKKYSYAASFGFLEIPKDYINKYRELLGNFNKISVREEQGKKIVNSLLQKKVPVVQDPTLLLNVNEWIEAFRISKNNNPKKYILLYLMIPEPNIVKFTEELAKETGYEIIYITDRIARNIKATFARTVSPVEWLELFLNATYIVTNSFHGVAFSINFNKNFFMGLLPSPANVNSRLENIINIFGLKERQIGIGNKIDIGNVIDYDPINRILSDAREQSMAYLKTIISDTDE